MEPLNNHMDDLFRKAGDHYPLKTSGSDWDRVLGRLKEENYGDLNAAAGIKTGRNRNKRRWFSLLIFIPLGLGSLVYFSGSIKDGITGTPPLAGKNIPVTENNKTKTNPANPGDPAVPGLNNTTSALKKIVQDESANSQTTSRPAALPGGENGGQKGISSGNKKTESNQFTTGSRLSDADSFHDPVLKTISLSVSIQYKNVSVPGIPFTLKSSPEVSLTKQADPGKGKSNTPKMQFFKGVYIGFLAGPDLSSVDFQSIKQPGYSLGFIAGYRFSKRIAVETGVLWDKKYYYSAGNYFDKSNTNIPAGETILNLNGYCNMFEIPVLLRYDFAVNNNHVFFAKTGFSSYLMKKEFYDINAVIGSWSGSYPYSYNNSTKNIFSILQLSAGYELAIGRKTRIQIEPYLKIPLQGIGIGHMPISSAGLYFGISHSFR
jgi:hypothetical protein